MDLSDKFKSYISSYLALNNHNVIAFGVMINNKIASLILNNDQSESDDLYFDLGSISKAYTARLVMDLVKKGKLKLEDTIDRYLDLKPGQYPSIKALLTHTSGYRYFTPPLLLISRFILINYQKENIYKNVTNKDVLRHIKPRKKKEYPYHYSDFNYAILAVIISRIYHEPFGDILAKFIKENLKLNKTKLSYDSPHNLGAYKGQKPLKYWCWNKFNPYLSGGGLSSCISDVMEFIKQELNTKNSEHFAWLRQNNTSKYTSFGCVGGFKSSLIFDDKHRLGVAVLTNSWGKKKLNARYICNVLYSELRRNKIKIT